MLYVRKKIYNHSGAEHQYLLKKSRYKFRTLLLNIEKDTSSFNTSGSEFHVIYHTIVQDTIYYFRSIHA